MNSIDILLVCETHFTSKSYFFIKEFAVIMPNLTSDKESVRAAIIIKTTLKYTTAVAIQGPHFSASEMKIKCCISDLSAFILNCPHS